MSVARGIAQARTYSSACTFLGLEIAAVGLVIGVESSSWWIGIGSLFVFGILLSILWTRILILVLFSLCWSWLAFEIATELEKGLWAYPVALFAFVIAYVFNGAGAIGFDHTVPDFN